MIRLFVRTVIVWVIGFGAFIATLPDTDLDVPPGADAIIVLTGDSNRITTGFKLFDKHRGHRMLISGVYPGTRVDDLALPYVSPRTVTKIDLDDVAKNTRQNAIETNKWMTKHNYKTMILVTSDYHMRRARMHFQDIMPNAGITPYPVSSMDKWWQSGKGIKTMIRAYNKLLVTWPLIMIR